MSDTNNYNVDMMQRLHSLSKPKQSLTMNRRCINVPPLNTSFNESNQFQNPFSNEGGDSDKAASHQNSTPPISPYSPIATGSQNFNMGPRLPRPPLPHFSLPPRSPSSPSFRHSPAAPPAERDGMDLTLPPIPFMMRANRPREDHRQSNTDIPFGIEAMIAPNPPQLLNQNPLELLDGAVVRSGESSSEKESLVEGTKSDEETMEAFLVACMNDIYRSGSHSEMEKRAELTTLGVKRRAGKEIAPSSGKHNRSFSMDTSFNDKLIIGGNESHNLPPLPPSIVSPTNSVDVNPKATMLGFGNGEFTPYEIKQIIRDDKLTEIAQSDPKHAKRILANRHSAARSKEKKHQHMIHLEHRLQTLKAGNTSLSAQVQLLQVDKMVLTDQQKELRHRIGAAEQQLRLREALFDQLNGELQQMKLATSQLSAPDILGMQSLNVEMFEQLDIDHLHQPLNVETFDQLDQLHQLLNVETVEQFNIDQLHQPQGNPDEHI